MWGPAVEGMECPNCVEHVQKYCNGNHYVVKMVRGLTCVYCGGVFIGGKWTYTCSNCVTDVEPGGLRGTFLPHLCRGCHDKAIQKDRARGNFCNKCRRVYAQCCC